MQPACQTGRRSVCAGGGGRAPAGGHVYVLGRDAVWRGDGWRHALPGREEQPQRRRGQARVLARLLGSLCGEANAWILTVLFASKVGSGALQAAAQLCPGAGSSTRGALRRVHSLAEVSLACSSRRSSQVVVCANAPAALCGECAQPSQVVASDQSGRTAETQPMTNVRSVGQCSMLRGRRHGRWPCHGRLELSSRRDFFCG